MTDNQMPQLDLAEVLGNLRHEIARAQRAAVGHDVKFTFSSIRVELSVAIEKSKSGSGGVKFWVVEAGAEAAYSHSTTHVVSFELETTSAATGRSPEVDGDTFAGETF